MSDATTKKTSAMPGASFAFIPLDRLVPNEYNARRFTENMTPQRLARFNELVASVREKGIIEPPLVRPIGLERYEVIAGERRYRAALQVVEADGSIMADYQVPCMIREVNDDDAFDLMIIENMQRDDLTPLETAQAFAAYLTRHGNTSDAVAELAMRTGIPAHAIRRQVRLLEVPAEVIAAWKTGIISQTHVDLFTRVGDAAQTLELLDACKRNKLSGRELAERIGAASPDLERGFFDKTECLVCHFNTSMLSGLFADVAPGGKCSNPSCFEAKQGAFLSANWLQSKAAEAFGTRGFRFGHRLGQDRVEPVIGKDIAERCRECDRFVSLLRLNGTVVSGYAQTCTGPVSCFEELYRAVAPEPAKEQVEETGPPTAVTPETSPVTPSQQTKPVTPPVVKNSTPPPAAPKEETGPVFSAFRANRFREAFFRAVLPAQISSSAANSTAILQLTLLALVLSSQSVKKSLTIRLNLAENVPADQLAVEIFDDMLAKEVQAELQLAAMTQILDAAVPAQVRQIVAVQFGADIAQEWELSVEYLDALSKSEIVRVGEEPGMKIWTDEKVEAYRKEHHQGKALLSLSKGELIDMIMKSGAGLKGRVPAEIIGTPAR